MIWPTAGNAALRPAQNSTRSCSSRLTRTVVAPAVAGNLLDPRHEIVDLDLRAVELDDQQALGVERIARADIVLGRTGWRSLSIISMPLGMMPEAMTAAT